MSSDTYAFPVAVSQLGHEDSREQQNARAIKWLLEQSGGPVVVVTPQKRLDSEVLKRLLARAGVTHLSWRGLSTGSLARRRVIHAWPDRQHLNDLWGVDADALVVIEWGKAETAEWIEDSNPVRLLRGRTVQQSSDPESEAETAPLPEDVDQILEHIAAWAAGYDSGLKWNEEDKLKADMMNCPRRWEQVTVEQVRAKCRALKMRPKDVDTITGYLQRRKEGRRFNVRSSYRTFRFS
ncbi:hypothetical protein [Propioniciclava sp.]|uniref:hypothetical protein n=1 Tax=Propioniciclava sp. TaxID=2038686 RepID=UPI00261184D0|nr:hypothetical protein [Propioniciclava sp.]